MPRNNLRENGTKSLMNRVLNLAVGATSAVVMASRQVDAAVVNVTKESTSCYTMTDGNTYVIQNSVTFSNFMIGGSGMTVADGATVVLYVPAGITLTAIGAHGSGQIGGGAGIRVPETSTLIITGEGTVNAIGGNAGNGGNGANGANGGNITCSGSNYDYGTGTSGEGGNGGVGGGGAAAGIGGNGGIGGSGGAGGAGVVRSKISIRSGFGKNGLVGNNGSAGSSGDNMGTLFVIGSTFVQASAGYSGNGGFCGSIGELTVAHRSSSYWFCTCGGGGGGGGGGGTTPSLNIGGGGASGGGGAGGGSGATCENYKDSFRNAHGGCGKGGMSKSVNGSSGSESQKSQLYYGSGYVSGGNGGAGGGAGVEGGAGTLFVSPTATVNVEREKLSATTHSAAQYTMTFNVNGGQFSSSVESLTATLGCELPDCIPTPTRSGYLFDGWMMISGEEYYDASGTKSISSYPMACDVILYAKWHLDDYYTAMTPEPVPYTYFSVNYPSILSEYGDDHEAAAKATAANGHNKIWECYVTGISPTNETAKFAAKIEMKDGAPVVTWKPNLNTNSIVRIYKVYGSETLENGGNWQYPTNSLHRFFKVTVEMP